MVLDKFEYSNCSSVFTPFNHSVQLAKHTSNPINQERYAEIIGSIMYLINWILDLISTMPYQD